MLYILFVGAVAGFLARLLSPGPNNPTGFILTIVLGVAAAAAVAGQPAALADFWRAGAEARELATAMAEAQQR